MFDWFTHFMESSGYLGVALLMFAENWFPQIAKWLNPVTSIVMGGAVSWYLYRVVSAAPPRASTELQSDENTPP